MIQFIPGERVAQSSYFAKTLPAGIAGYGGSAYRLLPQNKALNLAPSIRADAIAYFNEYGIAWHQHANHALSSQAGLFNAAGRAVLKPLCCIQGAK